MPEFVQITLAGWRQFADVDIDLSKQITILTGQNGCGKTTVLNILSKHFGWNVNFVSTPFWSEKKTKRFWCDVTRAREGDLLDPDDKNADDASTVGQIKYSDGKVCRLTTKTLVSAQYQLQYADMRPVEGLHIPSHRLPAVYHAVKTIPTDPKAVQRHYQDFQQLLIQTYGSPSAPRQQPKNPGMAQKESIIALALFGYGNQAVSGNVEYRDIFEQFQDVLARILPKSIGFIRLEVRMPEVVLVTRSGDFSLDAMSGGINALFGIAWQIHMYGAGKNGCTVTIDEPENHLHPSMQREFLPSLAIAFPKFRFVIATHSPFIISSHYDSSVYGLMFGDDRRVRSKPRRRACH
jgi:predicted ATPase